MRKLHFIYVGVLLCGLLAGIARAETFKLNDGQTITGEIVGSPNDAGIKIRVEEGKYETIPWGNLAQSELKKFAQDPKLKPVIEAFIEVTQEERIKKTEVVIKPVPRLERPAPKSLIGALFSSSVGVFLILAFYAGNIYAAYEIAVFRAQPKVMVCGIAAIAPLVGPIVFLCMPTRLSKTEDEGHAPTEPAGAAQSFSVPNPEAEQAAAAAAAGGLHLAHGQASGAAGLPQTQTFQRGAFTFNRRFFETKFSGFFGIVRRDAEKDMVLLVKSARGTYTAQRITRIAANDVHLHVQKGPASEEVMVPFSEIQEVQLKHKDA